MRRRRRERNRPPGRCRPRARRLGACERPDLHQLPRRALGVALGLRAGRRASRPRPGARRRRRCACTLTPKWPRLSAASMRAEPSCGRQHHRHRFAEKAPCAMRQPAAPRGAARTGPCGWRPGAIVLRLLIRFILRTAPASRGRGCRAASGSASAMRSLLRRPSTKTTTLARRCALVVEHVAAQPRVGGNAASSAARTVSAGVDLGRLDEAAQLRREGDARHARMMPRDDASR